MTTEKAKKAKLVRKITIGTINGVRGGFKNVQGEFLAMSIIGEAQSFKEHTSETMGVSYAFNGEFRAKNREGVEYVGPVCFLPEPAQGMLHAALDQEERVGGIRFAFDFLVVEDDTAIKGYRFECEPLVEPKPSDALAQFAASIGYESAGVAAALALDAPKADDAQAEKPAAEKPKGGSKK